MSGQTRSPSNALVVLLRSAVCRATRASSRARINCRARGWVHLVCRVSGKSWYDRKSTDVSSVETDQSGQGRMTQIAGASDGKAASVTPVKDESPALAKTPPRVRRPFLATDLGPRRRVSSVRGARVSPGGVGPSFARWQATLDVRLRPHCPPLGYSASGRELRRLTHPTALRPVAFHP